MNNESNSIAWTTPTITSHKLKIPPTANWRFYFGDSSDVYFQFYIKTPPNRFQRWMTEKVLGIRWEKVE